MLFNHDCSLHGQICRLIVNHLTTSIAEIDIYIRNNPTGRETLKNLACLRPLSKASEGGKKSKARSVEKSRGKNGEAKTTSEEEAKLFLQSLDVEEAEYTRQYGKTIDNMGFIANGASHEARLSPDLGLRIAVMSGLSWNHSSKSKPRDWFMQAAAITVETLLIPRYRPLLLTKCPGARTLRSVLQKYFASVTPLYFLQNVMGNPTAQQEWYFPDNLTTQPDQTPMQYDADDLASCFVAAEELGGTKKDMIAAWVAQTEKDKFLLCSSKGEAFGTLESLAHHAISMLAHVSVHLELN